jgi:DNA-binding CsgD family transcriptional regulator
MTSEIRNNQRRNAEVLTRLKGRASQTAPSPEKLEKLGFTRRESEVLHWVIQGKRDFEISVILSANRRTVEKHVQNILRKLRVETRTGATFTILQKIAGPTIIARSWTDFPQEEMHQR